MLPSMNVRRGHPGVAQGPRTPLTIFFVALLIRLAAVAYVTQFHSAIPHAEAGLGGEAGRIARSLALGDGFGSPLHVPTGPTAWVAPVYPHLLAGVFGMLGVYSDASAIAIRVLNAVFSALTCLVLWSLARQLFGATTAVWTAWAWAFFPYAIQWTTLVWDTALTTLLLSLACLVTVRLRETDGNTRGAAFGLAWGVAALTNPAVLSVYPAALVALYHRLRAHPRVFWRLAGISFVALVLALTPWTVRNARTFGEFVPIKGDLGFNLYLGNHEGATGSPSFPLHPWNDTAEQDRYQALGERAYFGEKEAEARDFIRSHPAAFLRLTAKRAFQYWGGYWSLAAGRIPASLRFVVSGPLYALLSLLALGGILRAARARHGQAILPVGATLLFPLLYYVTVISVRYRHPIEPLLVMLGVWFLTGIAEAVAARRPRVLRDPRPTGAEVP
jgi:4-amino-4-deoxy-L-arabinose transferase-like glycosyltransferase